MSKREVTIYTCDGCRAQQTFDRHETARGFSRVLLPAGEVWLCTVCYGAVEWVAKFQRITIPPKVFKHDRGYGLRKEKP
ncbi:hypothetical protein ACIPY5_12185 [Microbacterium sp. NPDC089698]|uniref:hypothetical protein n=1 Tax=Microbacterium sp. NPDC089698 TaxID=3364200 RepID=UPI0038234EC1